MTEIDLARRARLEIEELHRFFVEWLCGTCANSDAAWSRAGGVLDPRFRWIGPDATCLSREGLTSALRSQHGSLASPAVFEIWIENFACDAVVGDVVVASYEEWQRRDSGVRGRHSSVIFVSNEAAPQGLAWLRVHETWLPASVES